MVREQVRILEASAPETSIQQLNLATQLFVQYPTNYVLTMFLSGNLIVPQCGYAGVRQKILEQFSKAESEKNFSSIVKHNFETFRIRNVLPLMLEMQSQLK